MKKIILTLALLISTVNTFANDKGKVFALCTATQGNGYNWGSTLGWLSEIVKQTVLEAKAYEKNNKAKAYIDLSCQTGSSSSGFLTALYDQLLYSRDIKGKKNNDLSRQLLTINEAAHVAKALAFLSISSDFHSKESLAFKKEGLKIKLSLWKDIHNDNKLGINPWHHIANEDMVMDAFMIWINAARNYKQSWHQEIFPLPAVNSFEQLEKLSESQMSKYDIMLKNKMLKARELVDSVSNKGLTKIKNSSLSDDYCNTVYMLPADINSVKPFSYENLNILYLCNENTFNKLSKSNLFKGMLDKTVQMKNKIMLGSVPNWKTSLNLTMREPKLLNELSGSLKQLGLTGVKKYNNGEFTNLGLDQTYLVMGGFPGPRLQAWASKALLEERLDELSSIGYEVKGRMAVFGKIDIRDKIGSFAEQTIVDFFKGGNDNLKPFYEWQDELCQFKNQDSGIEFFSMDWNLSKSPAAMTDQSYILTVKGINLAKVQTDISLRPYYLDPMHDKKFLPDETTACAK